MGAFVSTNIEIWSFKASLCSINESRLASQAPGEKKTAFNSPTPHPHPTHHATHATPRPDIRVKWLESERKYLMLGLGLHGARG